METEEKYLLCTLRKGEETKTVWTHAALAKFGEELILATKGPDSDQWLVEEIHFVGPRAAVAEFSRAVGKDYLKEIDALEAVQNYP